MNILLFGNSLPGQMTDLRLTWQWEFQVGPSVGIEAGDHIWCARYLLEVNILFQLDSLHPCIKSFFKEELPSSLCIG